MIVYLLESIHSVKDDCFGYEFEGIYHSVDDMEKAFNNIGNKAEEMSTFGNTFTGECRIIKTDMSKAPNEQICSISWVAI